MSAKGIRITLRGEDFLITDTNGNTITAEGISELVKGRQFVFDKSLEQFSIIDPIKTKLVSDDSNGYRKTKLFIQTHLNNAQISSEQIEVAHKSATHLLPYQYEPTIKALRLPRPRILIADAVGLGKTIEVGIFLAEMMKRGRGKRVLVVALKSILGQFQQEIWNRFAIPLVRLDSQGILRLKAQLPINRNPFEFYDKTIISIDTLKNNGRFLNYIEQTRWDIIVIDECHIVANTRSQRGNLAQLLAQRCESLVLASATPHNGRRESFANLMRMLDPTSIPRTGDFTKEDIEPYYVRRLKNDIRDQVKEEFPRREVIKIDCNLFPEEEAFLEFQQQLKHNTLKSQRSNRRGFQDVLFTIQLFKSYLSSPESCLKTIQNRLKRIETLSRDETTKSKMRNDLNEGEALVKTIINHKKDSKYNAFKKHVKEEIWAKDKNKRLLIFTERVETLKALAAKLKHDFKLKDTQVALFHGGLSDTEQQSIVDDFGKEDSTIKVMITSDAGAAGVNLHYYCHHLFNYDIPWSIITLDQRNGRIDRYKQRLTPYIFYLIAKSDVDGLKTDLHIIDRLREKEEEVYSAIGKEGDAASVFKLYDTKAEEKKVQQALINSNINYIEEPEVSYGEAEEDEDDWFDDWEDDDDISDGDKSSNEKLELESTTNKVNETIVRKAVSFFGTEKSYYQALIEQLKADKKIQWDSYEMDDDNLFAANSKELQQLLYQLPKEAIKSKNKRYELTLNKKLVQHHIDLARTKKGEWASYQILYELNPIAKILMNKLQASIPKDAAFVAKVTELPEDSQWVILHGQFANGLGQPVISTFFVVGLTDFGTPHPDFPRPIPFESFVEKYDITKDLFTYTTNEEKIETLQANLKYAIQHANIYLTDLRSREQVRMENKIAAYTEKLDRWFKKSTGQISLQIEDNSGMIIQKLKKREIEIKTIKDEQSQYYQNMEALDNEPFIQVLAVFWN